MAAKNKRGEGLSGAELNLLHSRYRDLDKTLMANWFNLSAMFGTIKDVFLSGVLSSRLDYRQIEATSRTIGNKSRGDESELPFFDYSTTLDPPSTETSFWFDYVADVGDGFNPTYHVAQHLAKQELIVRWRRAASTDVELPSSHRICLPRGSLLILGGDEVYPSATRSRYEEHFIKPYEAAAYQPEPQQWGALPHMFALPGNHDWYDGLSAFMRVFAERRAIGLWRTRQDRSYFAIKLPQKWWIFGLDVGLCGELDIQQVLYFEDLVQSHMSDGDRIILCLPEPVWAKPQELTRDSRDVLFYFDRRVAAAAGGRDICIAARIAGDLHHYRDHTSMEPGSAGLSGESSRPRLVHNITAGGGGAFLHPTHDGAEVGRRATAPGQATRVFKCDMKSCFPSLRESEKITKQNAAFAFRNRGLWLSLTFLYSSVFYLWFSAFRGEDAGRQKALLLVALSVLLGFALVRLAKNGQDTIPIDQLGVEDHAVTHRTPTTWPAIGRGLLHAVAQIVPLALGMSGALSELVGCCLTRLLSRFTTLSSAGVQTIYDYCFFADIDSWVPMNDCLSQGSFFHNQGMFFYHLGANVLHLFMIAVRIGLLAGLTAFISMVIFGCYLWISLNRHRVHCNDAFASLRLECYKNFLRFRITKDELTIYPIGFRRVPNRWHFVVDSRDSCPAANEPLFIPDKKNQVPAGSGYEPMLIDGPIRIDRLSGGHHLSE